MKYNTTLQQLLIVQLKNYRLILLRKLHQMFK